MSRTDQATDREIADEGAGLRPLRRDAERNRQLILAAARTLFAERGLEVSMDDVAKQTGLGVGTVYRRFPTRGALIDALFADRLTAIAGVAGEALRFPRAFDGLRHFLESMVEMQATDKGLRDVMLSGRPVAPGNDLIATQLRPPLVALLTRAEQDGDLRPGLTATDVAVLEIAVQSTAEFTAAAAPDAWRRYLAIVLDGMRARPVEATEPFDQPPLGSQQLYACMDRWKDGFWKAPPPGPGPKALAPQPS
jgi:AcrR family transcriptional regulator